jgi:hypothetical protein
MTIPTILGFDVTGDNITEAPAPDSGLQAALYVTGDDGVPATSEDLERYPMALRIAQWPTASVDDAAIADYFDAESGAITLAMLPGLIQDAITAFKAGTRPGQRWPAVYCGDQADPTEVANTLNAAGLGSELIGLVIVDWSLTVEEATAMVANASGPYPVVGVQYNDEGPNQEPYDEDVFSQKWVNDVSTVPNPPVETGNQANWAWCNKCRSLFFGPQQSESACPKGGTHDGAGSYNYSLPFTHVSASSEQS